MCMLVQQEIKYMLFLDHVLVHLSFKISISVQPCFMSVHLSLNYGLHGSFALQLEQKPQLQIS